MSFESKDEDIQKRRQTAQDIEDAYEVLRAALFTATLGRHNRRKWLWGNDAFRHIEAAGLAVKNYVAEERQELDEVRPAPSNNPETSVSRNI